MTTSSGVVTVGPAQAIADAVTPTLAYKAGWAFKIGGPYAGTTRCLCVFATTPDSSNPARHRTTQHMFPIPNDIGTTAEFVRWVFDRLLDCERHEAGEFFTVAGHRPFYPNHGDEGSPYDHVERWETP